jgi:hypothetical protein
MSGTMGVWFPTEGLSAADAAEFAQRIEALGYSALWLSETFGRDPFAPQNLVNPGIERYQVRGDRTGCDIVWINDTSIGNSAQLSTVTGLIYGWAPDADVTTLDAYYFTANDWVTGDEVFRIYAGDGQPFNPVLGQPHLGVDGVAYVGSLQGIIRIADGPSSARGAHRAGPARRWGL